VSTPSDILVILSILFIMLYQFPKKSGFLAAATLEATIYNKFHNVLHNYLVHFIAQDIIKLFSLFQFFINVP